MKRRRTLITSPLEWQMMAAPVSAPRIPVLAERGDVEVTCEFCGTAYHFDPAQFMDEE